MSHPQTHGHHANTEEDVIDYGGLIKLMVYLTVVTVVVHIFVLFLMRQITADLDAKKTIEYPLALEQGERLPPLPRLQTQPKQELADLRAGWAHKLDGYSWVDKGAGVVRLPIEEAKKRVLTQGLPVRAAQPATAQESTEKK